MSTAVRPAHLALEGSDPRRECTARDQARLFTILLLLVCSLLAWRRGEYYSGGIDPVVAGKAALTVIALGLAIGQAVKVRSHVSLGPRTPLLIFSYILVTWLGGWANGSLVASSVLSVRVLLTAATVGLVVSTYPRDGLIRTAMWVFGGIGTAVALSGVGSLASRGRLYGDLVPMNPNQIAMLLGPPLIWLAWRMLRPSPRLAHVAAFMALLGLTWLTGSRTGLAAVIIALAILLVQAKNLPRGAFLGLLAALPCVFYIMAFTDVFGGFVGRDGAGNVATLNSRTIAWSAIFTEPTDFWTRWFGGGLVVKTVAVTGQYWSEQVLDSSWVSAYAQAGVIGVCLMGVWALTAIVAAARVEHSYRGLLSALVVYALIRSVLENGLIDSYVLFVIILVPALVAELRPPVMHQRADGGFVDDHRSLTAADATSQGGP